MATENRFFAFGRRGLWITLAAGILAMWCTGLFLRSYWTPDEPREAVLSLSMQPGWQALPTLAGQPFAEKPPLTYWLAASSGRALGNVPAALRAPQLAYALVALLAMVGLGRRAGNANTGWLTGALFATSALVYQVQIWLACDALLLCGVCISLYGMYAALHALTHARRCGFYLFMYVGLTLAFYGKNLAGLLVPVTTYLAFVLWEKRWRELLRWELWLGLLLPVALILPWLLDLAASVGGLQELRVLFWNNLVGRAISVSSEARYAYATAHRNWFGKYWVELASYVMPWCALAAVALWRSVARVRQSGTQRAAWRFALCAFLPGMLLLSLAATARGIYAAPSMAGLALLMGLWLGDETAHTGAAARNTVRISGGLLAALAMLVFVLTLLVQRSAVAVAVSEVATVSLMTAGLVAVWGLVQVARPAPGPPDRAVLGMAAAFTLLMSVGTLALLQIFNSWQDLPKLARELQPALADHPVVLWHPDETTEAWTTLYLPHAPALVIEGDQPYGRASLEGYLTDHPKARILVLAHGPVWSWQTWRRFLAGAPIPSGTSADGLQAFHGLALRVLVRVERPGGRAYWVLGQL